MDELTLDKLRAMGIKKVPKKLAEVLTEYKRKQDAVRPGPIPLEVLALCAVMYGKPDEPEKPAKKEKKEG